MAGLSASFSDTLTPEIQRFARIFPDLNRSFLGRLGSRAAGYLRNDLLSGQALNLKRDELDAKGHRMVTYGVNRRKTNVRIYAYPANLFEKGRTLRDGSRESGRYIVTKQLRAIVSQRLGADIVAIEKRTYEAYFKSRGL